MLTLEEAIEHCEEVAAGMTKQGECQECANDHKQLAEWLQDYRRLLGQEPCEDAISREMALDCDMSVRLNKSVLNQYPVGEYDYENLRKACFHGIELAKHEMEGYLVELPPVTPKPKMGQWFIDERPESDREIICSNCEQPIFKYHKMDFDYRPKYCPNCGAKMQ